MDQITVPYKRTSDKKIVSQIIRAKYIESFCQQIDEWTKAFDDKISKTKWINVADDLWLYTPFDILIYDPTVIPKNQYDNKGERYLRKDELEKAFFRERTENPFYDRESDRIRYMNGSGTTRYGYYIRCGRTNCFDMRDGSEGSGISEYNFDYDNYVCIKADTIPKEESILSYFLMKENYPFANNSKNKQFYDILYYLFHHGKISVPGKNINVSTELIDMLQKGTFSEKEFSADVYSFFDKLMKGQETGCCQNLSEKQAIQEITNGTFVLPEAVRKEILWDLLACDFKRNAMDLYDETRLKDPNGGHWELWQNKQEKNKKQKNVKEESVDKGSERTKEVYVSLDTGWMARNPVADVKWNGVVGIDFGTKSTVVTFRDGSAKIRPLRVGKGKYSEQITKEDYENPTVIEFKDMVSFMNEYQKKVGRPDTQWEDVTVSHYAAEQMKAPTSQEVISSYFSDIKQWTSDPERQVRIRDQKNHERVLGQYRKIKEDDAFDPLEIYAYYLGLFINNMRQGIYLRYKLSYPAKAETELREKLRKSFEKGLKKSLPQAVLEDAESMNKFKVELGMSEPAAYAVSALRGYGFGEISDEDKIFYGIFDFGGGTTDFDFGVWETEMESRSYDYRITHFGENGDPYLGGENLIEYMAFDVFKENKETLLKEHIVFSKPHNCEPFIGSEMLISDSREAIVNLKKLAETLRGFWHGESEFVNQINTDKSVTLQLFAREGELKPKVELKVNPDKLNHILDEQIDDGIKQFFIAMRGAFSEKNKVIIGQPEKIHIFLAGNSSKSPRVTHLFKKHIDEYEKGIVEVGQGSVEDNYICIYPPLGTPTSDSVVSGKTKPLIDEIIAFEKEVKEKERVVIPGNSEENQTEKTKSIGNVEDELGKPSGKTGVAFGLLDSKVRVVQQLSDEGKIAFKFYLGYEQRRRFKTVLSPESNYMEWVVLTDVGDDDTVELYYTQLAEARTNEMSIDSNAVKFIFLNVDISGVAENAFVFIRAIDAAKIEYVVATKEEMEFCNGVFDKTKIMQCEIK